MLRGALAEILRTVSYLLTKLTQQNIASILTRLNRAHLQLERVHIVMNAADVFRDQIALMAALGEVTGAGLQFGNFRP